MTKKEIIKRYWLEVSSAADPNLMHNLIKRNDEIRTELEESQENMTEEQIINTYWSKTLDHNDLGNTKYQSEDDQQIIESFVQYINHIKQELLKNKARP